MIRRDDVYKIGKLGKPHGVKGEITFAITDDVFDRVDAEYLVLDINGILVPFYMEEYRFKNDENVLVKFEDIDTQERARNYTGRGKRSARVPQLAALRAEKRVFGCGCLVKD